jgi:hypothetical protein
MKEKKLEDALNYIKTLCFNGPDGGATFIRVASDISLPEAQINNMYGRINKAFNDQPDTANILVEALQTVRATCKADKKAVEFVESEIESLIKLQAAKDLLAGTNRFQQLTESISKKNNRVL